MPEDILDLPRNLGEGLVLRWATTDDAQDLADFNFKQHNDPPDGEPQLWLKDWTFELLNGKHPTTGPDDFTVVVDENKNGQIVSAAVTISQTWSYDGIPFDVGRPELIATEPEYRKRGLIKVQMDVLHRRSYSKDELVQVITGIPWFYRQFGYEMALELWGSRRIPFNKIPAIEEGKEERYELRPARLDDQVVLSKLYDIHCKNNLISCLRDDAIWKYELEPEAKKGGNRRNLFLVETKDGEPIGYAEIPPLRHIALVHELAVFPGFPLREVALFVARALKHNKEKETGKKAAKVSEVGFCFGSSHPVYRALNPELSQLSRPYAWYLRVADLAGFLRHIGAILESRMADGPLAGHSGQLKFNFYTKQLAMTFLNGKLTSVAPYLPEQFSDGDAFFPGNVFLQLLFGFRSLEELKAAFPDCYTKGPESSLLLESLFTRQHSQVVPIA
jgi:hypothetical protein